MNFTCNLLEVSRVQEEQVTLTPEKQHAIEQLVLSIASEEHVMLLLMCCDDALMLKSVLVMVR
jgi:hypothetical protein